jgi:hypothetical protein
MPSAMIAHRQALSATNTLRSAIGTPVRSWYAPRPPYELLRTELVIRAGDREWTATGDPQAWVPLRHRSAGESGEPTLLRIVKSPVRWTFGDGRLGAGMSEIHDRIGVGGFPAGLEG